MAKIAVEAADECSDPTSSHDRYHDPQTFRSLKQRLFTEDEINDKIPSQMTLPGKLRHITPTLHPASQDIRPTTAETSPHEAKIIPSTGTSAQPRYSAPSAGLSELEIGRLKREAFATDLRKTKKEEILTKKR